MTRPSITSILSAAALAVALIAPRPGLALVAGDLDPTFGTGGEAPSPEALGAFAIQPDGKIVVVQGGFSGLRAERLTAAGVPDPAFGTGGFANVDAGADAFTTLVAVQPDSKIVLAGDVFSSPHHNIAVGRLDATGAPDVGFGAGGLVVTDLGADLTAVALIAQADGTIVVLGQRDYVNSSTATTVIIRYQSDGSRDLTFGTLGVVDVDISVGLGDFTRDLVIQPDGKFLVVGAFLSSAFLVRLDATGALDGTFGTGGKTIASGPIAAFTDFECFTLALQADGKIVVGGSAFLDGNGPVWAVARVNGDGTIDSTFGSGGVVLQDIFSPGVAEVEGVALQADGKILAAGWGELDAPFSNQALSLVRYETNGSRDPGFGSGGVVRLPVHFGRAIKVAPDASIVTVSDNTAGPGDPLVSRFVSTGCSACQKPLVQLGKLTTPGGDDTLKFKGTATLPNGPIVDPMTNGVRVRVAGVDGTVLSDVTIPGGAGWKVNTKGNAWKWTSATGVGGIDKISVKKLPGSPFIPGNPFKFAVAGKTGSYGAVPNAPIRARLILDQTSPEAGQCAEPYFTTNPVVPNCVLNGTGSTLTCK